MRVHLLLSRGRGIRTPVNGFGDRRTATVLFPYLTCCFTNELYYSKNHFKRQAKNAILWKKIYGHAILFSVWKIRSLYKDVKEYIE